MLNVEKLVLSSRRVGEAAVALAYREDRGKGGERGVDVEVVSPDAHPPDQVAGALQG